MDYIESISSELDEAESDLRAARRYNEARDPRRFREAITAAQARIEFANCLSATATAEARIPEREGRAA